jgi:hypothetical protein
MTETEIDEYFVEAISNVSHANGVFRVTFAQNEDENSVRPITRLLIPANQLPRILRGLNGAAKNIGEKVREKQEDFQANAEDEEKSEKKTKKPSKK